jgi:hypothetical protein
VAYTTASLGTGPLVVHDTLNVRVTVVPEFEVVASVDAENKPHRLDLHGCRAAHVGEADEHRLVGTPAPLCRSTSPSALPLEPRPHRNGFSDLGCLRRAPARRTPRRCGPAW